MYSIKYSNRFEKSLISVLDYYEVINTELPVLFEADLKHAEKIICSFPLFYGIRYKEVRRYNLVNFPFCIFYTIKNKSIKVLTILHQTRDPKFWPEP
jgi:plasmid stabilization system protein ParE